MRISPESTSGTRLRKYGVSVKALRSTTLVRVWWMPLAAVTIPLPIGGCMMVVRRRALVRDSEGALADSGALAPLVHQFCHVHQRLEWGFALYIARHVWNRLAPRGVPEQALQVEREAYRAAREVVEAHGLEPQVKGLGEPESEVAEVTSARRLSGGRQGR
ncbi:MAG: hypothetical protein HY532_03960 [Chloroflexi bacterium]|nr:hypothetical protein [Chloroflexota bacterium]